MSYCAGRRAMSISAVLALLLTGFALTTHQRQMSATTLQTPEVPGAYNVTVETSHAGGGSTWTYTITKATRCDEAAGCYLTW